MQRDEYWKKIISNLKWIDMDSRLNEIDRGYINEARKLLHKIERKI